MYYKKQGDIPPVIKVGCAYVGSYFCDGYLYLEYSKNNIPSEILTEITQGEYEENKPVISEPEPTAPEPTEQDFLQAEILLNQVTILENQRAQDEAMAAILLEQLGV